MTDEGRRRRMDFILERRAQFAVDTGKLEGVVTRLANPTLEV